MIVSVLKVFLFYCQKNTKKQATQEEMVPAVNQNKDQGHLQQTKTFSSDVVIRRLNMQLDMLRVPLPTGKIHKQQNAQWLK